MSGGDGSMRSGTHEKNLTGRARGAPAHMLHPGRNRILLDGAVSFLSRDSVRPRLQADL